MKTIHWGILGCGDVTEVKSGPAFQKARGSELVAVMRRDGAKARDYAKRHGVSTWYDDADALIGDPRVDAVYIATPPGSHLELALKVATVGKPCYVGKPMARSAAECRLMNEAFARGGVPLFVAYYRRAMPKFVKARELIEAGHLGTVTGCRYHLARPYSPAAGSHWRYNAEQSGGGLFLDVGSHVLDLIDHLLNPFMEYAGSASALKRQEPVSVTDVEDRVSVSFRTTGGVVGDAYWNFAAGHDSELLEIDGTAGRLTFGVMGPAPLNLSSGEATETFAFAPSDLPHVQQPLIQTIVDNLLGNGICPSTGESAARTSAVMDAALESYYAGREDPFWTRPESWRRG